MWDSSCASKQIQIGMCHTDLKKGGCGEGAPISHFIMAKQLVSFFPMKNPKVPIAICCGKLLINVKNVFPQPRSYGCTMTSL